ncbi:MAG: hypothetical protein HY696_00310 [Deltaproteobacteria bacterium]|nr:hypothetical protein [Deltaproteobacteria bacterium]
MNDTIRGPLIGRLNTLLQDPAQRITAEQYRQLEQALFADGVVEEVEVELVRPLLENRGRRLVDATDRQRFTILLEESAFNWTRYQSSLAAQRLAPRTDTATMTALQRDGLPDIRAQLKALAAHTDGSFTLTLEKNGRPVTWHYRGEETSPEQLDAQLRPCSLFELFLVLEDYRHTVPEGPTREAATQVLSTIGRWFRHTHTWRDFYRRYYAAGRRNNDHVEALVQQQRSTHRVAIGDYPYFWGAEPSDETRAVLQSTLDHLFAQYPGIPTVLRDYHVSIELYSWDALMRTTTEFPQPPRRTSGASYATDRIQLNIDADPQTLAYILTHEIGHRVYTALLDQFHAVDAESIGATIEHHWTHLEQQTESGLQHRFPTHYMATAAHEWFAEAFAIIALGTTGWTLRQNLHSLIAGRAIGYAGLYHDFQIWDPVGFTLMGGVMAAVRDPLLRPILDLNETALSRLMDTPHEATFLAERAQWRHDPRAALTDLDHFCARLLEHATDRIMRYVLERLIGDAALSTTQQQQLLETTTRLHRYYENDDELVRLHARLTHRLGRSQAAYALLHRFEQRYHVDLDPIREEIAIDIILRPESAAKDRRFMLQHAAPQLLHRLLQHVEAANRVPRTRPASARPGRPASPTRPSAPDPRDAAITQLLALDRALPYDFPARARRFAEWPQFHAALQQLVTRLATDPRFTGIATALQRRYRLTDHARMPR